MKLMITRCGEKHASVPCQNKKTGTGENRFPSVWRQSRYWDNPESGFKQFQP